jgi:hypothetical protein
MEGLLSQMNAENRKRLEGPSGPSITRTPELSANAPSVSAKSPAASSAASVDSDRIKREDPEMAEQFGQLALDEHGHGRFLGTSSTIALISSFRALTNTGPDRASPGSPSDDGLAPPSMSSLYFPGAVMFGKVRISFIWLYMQWRSLRESRQRPYQTHRRSSSPKPNWQMPL